MSTTESKEVHCPRCNSTSLTANKKGFSGGKAVAGAVLTGGIGLLAGTIGSKKIIITCLNCGKQFSPGEGINSSTPATGSKQGLPTAGIPKLIWDEKTKTHIKNPKYKDFSELNTTVLAIIFIVAVLIILKACSK